MSNYDFKPRTLPVKKAFTNYPFEPEMLVSYCIYPLSEVSTYNNTAYIRRFIHYANTFYKIPWSITAICSATIPKYTTDAPIESFLIVYNIALYTIVQMFRYYDPQDSHIDSPDAIYYIQYYTERFLQIAGITKEVFGQLILRDFIDRNEYYLPHYISEDWPKSIVINDARVQRFYNLTSTYSPKTITNGFLVSPFYIEADEMLVNMTYEKYLGNNAINIDDIPRVALFDFLSEMYTDIAEIDSSIKTKIKLIDNRAAIYKDIQDGKIPFITTDYSSTYFYGFKR